MSSAELMRNDPEYVYDAIGNMTCISCKHCMNKGCKRFDVDGLNYGYIKPYRAYFTCETTAYQHHMICSDFDPEEWHVLAKELWQGFEWYIRIKQQIEPKLKWQMENRTLSLFLGDDTDTVYHMKIIDWIYGKLYAEDGTINYQYKTRYKQVRTGFGYEIERIDKE